MQGQSSRRIRCFIISLISQRACLEDYNCYYSRVFGSFQLYLKSQFLTMLPQYTSLKSRFVLKSLFNINKQTEATDPVYGLFDSRHGCVHSVVQRGLTQMCSFRQAARTWLVRAMDVSP